MKRFLSPQAWRQAQQLSLDAAARRLGVAGKNPARTWQRWELGVYEPPLSIVVSVEQISGGAVTAAAWAAVRSAYRDNQRAISAVGKVHA